MHDRTNMKPNEKQIRAAFDALDPYEHMGYAIGSGDDFICFDWTTIEGTSKGYFEKLFLLKATVNSETGHFIQTFAEYQCDWLDSPFKTAMQAVNEALDWCADNDVCHTKRGWNHDAYYLARDIWHDSKKQEIADLGETLPWKISSRQLRLGGKQINKACGLA